MSTPLRPNVRTSCDRTGWIIGSPEWAAMGTTLGAARDVVNDLSRHYFNML